MLSPEVSDASEVFGHDEQTSHEENEKDQRADPPISDRALQAPEGFGHEVVRGAGRKGVDDWLTIGQTNDIMAVLRFVS